MLNIGISNKVKVQVDPKEGFPKIISVNRILQGEPIETVCSHDITIIEGSILFKISGAFANCLKGNPVKAKQMDKELTGLFDQMRTELLESDKLVTQEDIDNISNSERFSNKLNSYKWMDFLAGNVSLYTVSDHPNADVQWNDSLSTWQVVAITEILPNQIINLPKPTE